MARNCNCAGSSCGCKVVAGFGISIGGTGTAADPFVITNAGANLQTALTTTNTVTAKMVKSGSGTNLDPLILSVNVDMRLQQLNDVANPGGNPTRGQVPTYVGTSGTDGHWEFQVPLRPFTTAARPAIAMMPAGTGYFDTTLNKPVWSSGTNYRDATGAIV